MSRAYKKRMWTVSGYNGAVASARLVRLEEVSTIAGLQRAVKETVKAKMVLRVEERVPDKKTAK